MTREEALKNLNLDADADAQQMEKAYVRLIRRYPPEFHPDRFRAIDESYRTLTSLPYRLEKMLVEAQGDTLHPEEIISQINPTVPHDAVEKSLAELRKAMLTKTLWP